MARLNKADEAQLKKMKLAKERRRTSDLYNMVAQAIGEHGKDAARRKVPDFAKASTISRLADLIAVDRSSLSLCLGVCGTKPATKIRERLEEYLGLSEGGMTQVLGQLKGL